MKKVLFCFALLFSRLSAEEPIISYLTSECDTLSLVGGVVNAYNGKLVEISHDIEIGGSDPMRLTRYYDGGHHFISEMGYSFGFSFPIAIVGSIRRKDDFTVNVEQRTGSHLPFKLLVESNKKLRRQKEKQKTWTHHGRVSSHIYNRGYTNCCEALIRGEPDLTATRIDWRTGQFMVTLGDGTRRYYDQYLESMKYSWFRLVREERPNGNKRYFSYRRKNGLDLSKIWTTDSTETVTLNSLDFSQTVGFLGVTASNGQKAHYHLEKKTCKKVNWTLLHYDDATVEQMALVKFQSSHLPRKQYSYIYRNDCESNLFSIKRIAGPTGNKLRAAYSNLSESVVSLYEGEKTTPLYTFEYGADKKFTLVTNALGGKKKYLFSNRRLKAIEEEERHHAFRWSDEGKLLAHHITDPNGALLSKRKYNYGWADKLMSVAVTGNITAKGTLDLYTVGYSYSADRFRLLLVESHNNKKIIRYGYRPGTNLMTVKLTYDGDKCVEREFFDYNSCGILIKKVVDDGSGAGISDLAGVSQRLVTTIVPYLDINKSGHTHPHIIQEYAVDLATGKEQLLKKRELLYIKGDLLAEEHVYDADGNYRYTLVNDYDRRMQRTGETNALGETVHYSYDDNNNRISEVKRDGGKKIFYQYDSTQRLIQEVEEHSDGTKFVTSHSYDAMGNRIATTDRYGQTTSWRYDTLGRQITLIDPLGRQEDQRYDANGHIRKRVDKDGHVTRIVNNMFGAPLEMEHPDGTVERCHYTIEGYLKKKWERDGTIVEYEVDYKGRPTKITTLSPEGEPLRTITKTYRGPNLVAETDGMGHETRYLYDIAGRLVEKMEGERLTHYSYDNLGRLHKTAVEDRVEVKEYDLLDRVIEERVEDSQGNLFQKVHYSYDINGNVIEEKVYRNPENISLTRSVYNSQNLPIAITDPEGNLTEINYRHTDHFEKESRDPLGRSTVEVFDFLQRLQVSKSFDSSGTLTSYSSYAYDGRGNIVRHHLDKISEGKSQGIYTIDITYNAMGEKTLEVEQSTKATGYSYRAGRLETVTLPNGVILNHSYDSLGRLARFSSSDNSIDYHYSYDLNDNLLEVKDQLDGTLTQRRYDRYDRLVYEKQANGLENSYSYDPHDRLIEVAFDSESLVYSYNASNLVSVQRLKNKIPLYSYGQESDFLGKPLKANLPFGLEAKYLWDARGCQLGIEAPTFSQVAKYDSVGNLISLRFCDSQGDVQCHYSYDSLNQIEEETGPFSNRYSHDSLHNRLNKNGIAHDVNSLNQLEQNGTLSYYYDLNGRRTESGAAQYHYDALGRLTSYIHEGERRSYRYDALGRKMEEKRNNAAPILYRYQLDTEIGTYCQGKQQELRILYRPHGYFAIEFGEKAYAVIRNHRGDTCQLIDSDGKVEGEYRYDSFGNFISHGAVEAPWLFTGQRYDRQTGLYHFFERFYDPAIGRWLTPDPIGFEDGPNLYAYVHNNPHGFFDPYGLCSEGFAFHRLNNHSPESAQLLDSTLKGMYHGTAKFGYLTIAGFLQGAQKLGLEHFDEDFISSQERIEITAQFNQDLGDTLNRFDSSIQRFLNIDPNDEVYQRARDNTLMVFEVGSLACGAYGLAKGAMGLYQLERHLACQVGRGAKLTVPTSRPINPPMTGRLSPNNGAYGAHTVFKRNQLTGKIEKYQTFWPQNNPHNPSPWLPGIRFDGKVTEAHKHFNKAIQEYIMTPHVHDKSVPGGVRVPYSWEIPK